MNTIELEAEKASLARQILSIDNQSMINNIWLVINGGVRQDNSPTLEQRRQAMERIMKRRETTPLRHYTDEELEDIRYEYLKEKHLRR